MYFNATIYVASFVVVIHTGSNVSEFIKSTLCLKKKPDPYDMFK